jgi:hypothetical protein
MESRVEWLAGAVEGRDAEPFQSLEKTLVNPFDPFQQRLWRLQLPAVGQRQLQVVYHGQELFDEVLVGELQQVGAFALLALF